MLLQRLNKNDLPEIIAFNRRCFSPADRWSEADWAELLEDERALYYALLENGQIVVRIRDYGPGIPEEELPHVKMKFYKGSSKARGSGIGLAVCEEIVTMHGGTITLENAEGGGTLVTISIPTGEE